MRTFFLLTLLTQFSVFAARSSGQIYDMSDLEILAAEKNFREFIPHAHDVRPGKRNRKWQDMFTNMLSLYLDDVLTKEKISKKLFSKVESLVTLPVVVTDIFIQNKRETIASRYFRYCAKSSPVTNCRRQMTRFWHAGSFSPDMGLTLGSILQKIDPKMTYPFWHYYENAVVSRQSEFYCRRNHVKKAILSHFNKEFMGLPSKRVDKKKIRKKLSNDCWQAIEKTLVSGLRSKEYNIKKLSFLALSSFRSLTALENDIFATHFILHGPVVGELFNKSWKTIEEMGRNYSRRQKVLSYFENSPTLPDTLFRSYRPKKKKILVNFMADYFPEYIEHYAKTCLDYLEGKKTFKKGNPTLGCHDLFKLSAGQSWPSEPTKRRYMKVALKNRF